MSWGRPGCGARKAKRENVGLYQKAMGAPAYTDWTPTESQQALHVLQWKPQETGASRILTHAARGTTGQGCTTGQENRGHTGRNTGSSPPRTCAPRVADMMRTLGHTPSCGVIRPCIRYHRTRSSWREARLIWPRPFCNPASPSSFLSRVLGQHIPSIIPHHPRPQPRVLVGACACVHHVCVCVCVRVCVHARVVRVVRRGPPKAHARSPLPRAMEML